jgi:hypothetical protein
MSSWRGLWQALERMDLTDLYDGWDRGVALQIMRKRREF